MHADQRANPPSLLGHSAKQNKIKLWWSQNKYYKDPNSSRVRNNSREWKIIQNLIKVGSGIIVGGGKKQPIVSIMVAIIRYRYMPGKGTSRENPMCLLLWKLATFIESFFDVY